MTRTSTLLCFNQSRWFPEDTAHWALFLWDAPAATGTLFHASKASLLSGTTSYEPMDNINPATSRSLQASVEIATGLNLTDDELDALCIAAAENRPFDLVVNNRQRFCHEILQRLVGDGTITQDQVDALAAKGFHPLV
ncbi:hypothetical protein CBS147326_7606 [Penicillium roqueforti]|nr:hypothetical protein CBS147326_7606 [Penicillium roqueforti]